MLKLVPGLAVGTLLLILAIYLLAVVGGMAAEPCRGTMLMTSWYGPESGRRTANGEYFDGTSMTAASRKLPFGTRLRVTHRGKSIEVRVNDRGPYVAGRSLDLSAAAAHRIGIISAGVARVCVERLPP